MKKKIFIGLIIILVLVGGIFGIYKVINIDNTTAFTVTEQQWISDNKNNVVDLYVPSDIAIISNMGEGLVFDLIDDFEDKTKIKINATAYKIDNDLTDADYRIELVNKVSKDQILLYRDSYIVVVKDDKKYNSINDLTNLKLGVLDSDLKTIKEYCPNNEFTSFSSLDELKNSFENEETNELDGIIILRTLYLDNLLKKDYHIAYHITEMTKDFVLSTSGDSLLNGILQKYSKNWISSNFEISYNEHLLNEYFTINNISEKDKTSLQEKAYTYGYLDNGIYDFTDNKELYGINYYIIKSFARFANIDMDYNKPYKNVGALKKAFDDKKIDFYFNDMSMKCSDKCFETVSTISSDVVILANVNNNTVINSLVSIKNEKVHVVKDSMVAKYLSGYGIKLKEYDTMDKLLSDTKVNDLIAIDLKNYEYYSDKLLRDYKIQYIDSSKLNYGYVINNDNKIFMNLFNFYLEYNPMKNIINKSYSEIYKPDYTYNIMLIIIFILALIVVLIIIRDFKKLIRILKKRKHRTLSKQEKLKYIDQLTSLKNRAYLNDNIEAWDDSLVYPQTIAIIDLNNIAYINDNFGHEEGDKIIAQAANILIRTQLPRTEIIRTDGNEFLVYMIEYSEKQVVAYLKKITKEFKELAHGFGAAMGYSMINDEIKTVDDAVNEATIAMRENKEAMLEDKKS